MPLSLPAQKRECGIFGLDMTKNSIRSMVVKLASPQLLFATLAFGSGEEFKKKIVYYASRE